MHLPCQPGSNFVRLYLLWGYILQSSFIYIYIFLQIVVRSDAIRVEDFLNIRHAVFFLLLFSRKHMYTFELFTPSVTRHISILWDTCGGRIILFYWHTHSFHGKFGQMKYYFVIHAMLRELCKVASAGVNTRK